MAGTVSGERIGAIEETGRAMTDCESKVSAHSDCCTPDKSVCACPAGAKSTMASTEAARVRSEFIDRKIPLRGTFFAKWAHAIASRIRLNGQLSIDANFRHSGGQWRAAARLNRPAS